MNMYQIGQKYLEVGNRLLDSIDEHGEISSTIAAEFSSIEDQLQAKFAACCRLVKNLEAIRDVCANEADRLREKARTADNRIASLKDFMKSSLEAIGETKIRCDELFTVSIQQSPPSTMIENIDAVPTEFDKPQERQLMISAIRDALKSGRDVPGAKLVYATHLRIR